MEDMHRLKKTSTGYRLSGIEGDDPFELLEFWVGDSLEIGIPDDDLMNALLYMLADCEDRVGREAILKQVQIHMEECRTYGGEEEPRKMHWNWATYGEDTVLEMYLQEGFAIPDEELRKLKGKATVEEMRDEEGKFLCYQLIPYVYGDREVEKMLEDLRDMAEEEVRIR